MYLNCGRLLYNYLLHGVGRSYLKRSRRGLLSVRLVVTDSSLVDPIGLITTLPVRSAGHFAGVPSPLPSAGREIYNGLRALVSVNLNSNRPPPHDDG